MSKDGGVSRRQVEKLADSSLTEQRDQVDELGSLLSSEEPYVRRRAMGLLVDVAEEYPEAVADVVDAVVDRLGAGDSETDAARVVSRVAEAQPAALTDRLPPVVTALDGDGGARTHLTHALACIGESTPEALAHRGILETLAEHTDDETAAVRANVTGVLAAVAAVDPGAVADVADRLQDRLTDDSTPVRRNAAAALGGLAAHAPTAVFGATAELCRLATSDEPGVRASALYALCAAAAASEAVDDDSLGPVFGLLDADQPAVRRQAAFVLARVADGAPDALASHAHRLTRGLADPDEQTRANVLVALRRLETTAPDAVETARSDVSDALETVDPYSDSPAVTPAALRGLATDGRAPAPLRHAARDALASIGEPAAVASGSGDAPDDTGDPSGSDGKQCPDCGEQFGPAATFCAVCGASLE